MSCGALNCISDQCPVTCLTRKCPVTPLTPSEPAIGYARWFFSQGANSSRTDSGANCQLYQHSDAPAYFELTGLIGRSNTCTLAANTSIVLATGAYWCLSPCPNFTASDFPIGPLDKAAYLTGCSISLSENYPLRDQGTAIEGTTYFTLQSTVDNVKRFINSPTDGSVRATSGLLRPNADPILQTETNSQCAFGLPEQDVALSGRFLSLPGLPSGEAYLIERYFTRNIDNLTNAFGAYRIQFAAAPACISAAGQCTSSAECCSPLQCRRHTHTRCGQQPLIGAPTTKFRCVM